MIRVRVTVNGKVEHELDVAGEVTIGRKAPADVVVADGQVSSRHATLRPDGARLLVTDLGSTNGTRIDERERLPANEPVPFERGQKLLIGPAVIEMIAAGDRESSAGFGKSEKTVVVGSGSMQSMLVQIARFKAAHPKLVLGAEHAKRTVDITEMESVIGRDSSEAQVVVPHQSVSSRHAKIRFTDGRFSIEDLGSANGTFVSGVRIAGATPIEPQTALTIGTVECLFVARAPEAGGAQGAADPHAEVLCGHAVRLGRATEQQSRAALQEHRASGRTLGEIFIELGIFTPKDWAELYRQRQTIAALHAAAPSSASRGGSKIGLWIAIAVAAAAAAVAWKLGVFGGGAK